MSSAIHQKAARLNTTASEFETMEEATHQLGLRVEKDKKARVVSVVTGTNLQNLQTYKGYKGFWG